MLRNKMAIIIGSVDVILFQRERMSDEMVEDLTRIRKSAEDALRSIDALTGGSAE